MIFTFIISFIAAMIGIGWLVSGYKFPMKDRVVLAIMVAFFITLFIGLVGTLSAAPVLFS